MPPGGCAQRHGVVVRHAGEDEAVVRQLVPLLAGHLAGLAADADRGVGEEALARDAIRVSSRAAFISTWCLRQPSALALRCVLPSLARSCTRGRSPACAPVGRSRSSSRSGSSGPSGPLVASVARSLRPGSIVAGERFDLLIDTFGSATNEIRSFADIAAHQALARPVIRQSDLVNHAAAQCAAAAAAASPARALRSPRARVRMVAQPPLLRPVSRRQFRRDLAEHLRLQFRQPREPARHAARRVMLGQAISGQHVRKRGIVPRLVIRVVARASTPCAPDCTAARTADSASPIPAVRSASAADRPASPLGAKIQPLPSGFMMNGSMPRDGVVPARVRCRTVRGRRSLMKSGTSWPVHFCVLRPTRRTSCAPTRACPRDRRRRGCRASGDSAATPMPIPAPPNSAPSAVCGARSG